MLPRFYAPDLDPELERVTLPPEEARHLTRVLRLSAGDEVAVFDGRGTAFRAVVEVAVRDTASLQLLEPMPTPAASRVQITVVQAVLKGDSMDDAVRDATMMGAAAIEPVLTEHTDVKVSVVRRPATLDRWRRVALAAAKQSRRATLPEIGEPRSFDDWLASASSEMKLLFVEPAAAAAPRLLKSLADETPRRTAVVLGPEGGWSPSEIDAAVRKGCIAVTLGPLTLRAESMPVASLAAIAATWPSWFSAVR